MDKKEQILHYHRIDGLSQREILGGNVPVPDVTQQKIGLMFSQSDFYC
ncbi:MAG: hypothetical protein IKP43_04470 [Bacteroidaceae bacterium]|nr:hypothetical protein [Bacteroidaceae bacterium]